MSSKVSELSKDLVELPSATKSVFYFMTITLVYGFMMIYSIINSTSADEIDLNSSNNVYLLIYVIFLLSGTYFINVNISKSICRKNSIKWAKVFQITLLPWLIIFGLLYFLLELFPGWNKPFSNTIGYFIINVLGATEKITKIININREPEDKTLKIALHNIKKNYSVVINKFDTKRKEFEKFIRTLTDEQIINNSNVTPNYVMQSDDVVQFYALIKVKDLIGKLVWYILAGTLIASISYNFIINMSCEKTLEQANKDYSNMFEKSYVPVYGKKWRKLSEEPPETESQDFTGRLSEFITTFGNHLLTQQDSNNEVELSNHQLRSIQLSFDELPSNSYIQIDNSYFRPIE